MHIGGLARHRGFAWLLLAWLGVMVVCSAAMYVAEKGANNAIENPFDALWWGVVTLTTVGYGDVVPHTIEGRLAAMALMLLGIGLFGAITATITSYFLTATCAASKPKSKRTSFWTRRWRGEPRLQAKGPPLPAAPSSPNSNGWRRSTARET